MGSGILLKSGTRVSHANNSRQFLYKVDLHSSNGPPLHVGCLQENLTGATLRKGGIELVKQVCVRKFPYTQGRIIKEVGIAWEAQDDVRHGFP